MTKHTMKTAFFTLLAAAVLVYGPSASAAKYGNALNGKVCIWHAPAGSTAKAFKMLLPRMAAEAHLAHHSADRPLPPSACRLRKPGANK